MSASSFDWQRVIAHEIAGYSQNPLACARYCFPWGEKDLEESNDPYDWQIETLQEIGKHLVSKHRHKPLRIAIASGNGIGKSALVAMLSHWALSTFTDCKVVVTATTGQQLRTKTQPEVAKWFRMAVNAHWFEVGVESIHLKTAKHQKTWRLDFMTWDEANPDAFLGLHNKRKRIIVIFDEASGIADVIWDTIQRALTDKDTEIIWIALGNPNHSTGRFAECFGSDKYRWITKQIDSRTVPGTNKQELDEWVKKYGEDSDYVRYSVRGEFPRGGSDQFIAGNLVAEARHFRSQVGDKLAKILSCDVARFGDDETVWGLRQGRKFQILGTYRGIDTEMTAQHGIEFIDSEKPDAVVIDGDGVGGGVIDHIKARNYEKRDGHQILFEYHGAAAAKDPAMYYNKRAECWGACKDWLAAGAEIPDDPQLDRELTGPKYFVARGKINNGSIVIESKEDMKKRGVASPNRADCLIQTFGVKLLPRRRQSSEPSTGTEWS